MNWTQRETWLQWLALGLLLAACSRMIWNTLGLLLGF